MRLIIAVVMLFVSYGIAFSATIPTTCPSISAYGGVGDGITNNVPAFNAAVAASINTHACVSFGPGTFYFANTISVIAQTMGSVTIDGQGPDVTTLEFPAGSNGLTIKYADWSSSATVENLSITTMGAGAGTGLSLSALGGYNNNQNAQSNVVNVTLRGSDGYAKQYYWENAIYVYGVRWVNFTNVLVDGGGGCSPISGIGCYSTNNAAGVVLTGTAALVPVQFNFQACGFNYVGTGILYGPYTEGVVVNMSEFVGGSIGIDVTSNAVGTDQLTVSNSNFNTANFSIYDQMGVPNTTITGNTFLVPPNAQGVDFLNSSFYTVVGNSFQGITGSAANNHGFVVEHTNFAGIFSGNSVVGLAAGVWLKVGTSGVNVQSNSYTDDTVPVTNSGNGNRIGGGSS